MKLKFEKNKDNEIIVTQDGNNFSSQGYVEIIKQLHLGGSLEVEFGKFITEEEKNSINEMVNTINAIDIKNNRKEVKALENSSEEDINPEDIPF